MQFKIYTGESIAKNLNELGISATFTELKTNCSSTKYHFNLVNLKDLTKLKNVVKMLSAHLHTRVTQCDSKIAHFCLEIPNSIRYFPKIEETWYGINDFSESAISFGLNDDNQIIARPVHELQSMLISGASGSGKSVFLNNIILNIHCHPDDTCLILIDPKEVEFGKYENSDRLVLPVATDIKSSIEALKTLCMEMDRRYKHLRNIGLRDNSQHTFCKIICIIDELADLMLTSKGEVENYIVRLAQKGRACGIYLILATQRPTVNVVTGLIKANIGTRVAFACTSMRDSMVMLDYSGAERLLGKGDCLIKFADKIDTIHCQAPFVTDENINEITKNWKPRNWNIPKTTPPPPKTTWLDKLLGKVAKWRGNAQNGAENGTTAPRFSTDEQNFYDCADDEE